MDRNEIITECIKIVEEFEVEMGENYTPLDKVNLLVVRLTKMGIVEELEKLQEES